ncbi:MAG: bifunctional methylenetetrahydrofolate dehydrogenase/methenyltetrahydrofolate cyclohydrolase FolD [bacterium]|nr:bifunctional methylenetetrahydrofolate dehydrogenase/methenyltetrahydrofolate cyclohydrolase FolD [bacterium]MDW8104743.1 bifunctional methylenetetrahydrofolate dehydrogenase/methenyltetrahydrofolate cyclohydrolase FolD [Armatimonadota bacterium]
MSATLLDGAAVAARIREELRPRVQRLREAGIVPKLSVLLIGDDPASHTYVRMKAKACRSIGIESETFALPRDTSQQEAEELIARLNADESVHGILVQHPVPKGLDEIRLLSCLSPDKDVDGISPASLGALVAGVAKFISCTPLGIVELLDRYQIPIEGQRAVVVGRSIILGKPLALLLLQRNATVTVCHTRTRDLPSVTREADILVAACGRAELITGDMIRPGAVVVDAGYNRVEGRSGDVGDVHFESASQVASYITPVPGGVGPMTIAMLLSNTVRAAEMRWERG